MQLEPIWINGKLVCPKGWISPAQRALMDQQASPDPANALETFEGNPTTEQPSRAPDPWGDLR